MVESALEHIAIFADLNFHDIVVSLKATDIALTVAAYEQLSKQVDYPLHLGITEAGTKWFGTIKSAAGLGALLSRGFRRYAQGIPHFRSGRRGQSGLGNLDGLRLKAARPTLYFLPHLRQNRNRFRGNSHRGGETFK